MAIISPEQQAAAVAQQAQAQLYASGQVPPQAPSPYVSAIQQHATAATFGLTNVALPMAGLVGGVGASALLEDRALRQATAFWGRTAGRPMLGRVMGTAARGVGGIAVPALVAAGIMHGTSSAATHMIEGQRDFLATRSLASEISDAGSASTLYSRPSSALGSTAQIGHLQEVAGSLGFGSSAQTRNLISGMNSAGLLNTQSVSTISESLRRGLADMKSLSHRLGQDVEAVLQMYNSLGQSGLTNRLDRLRTLSGMAAVSGMTGVSMGGLSQAMTQGAQSAMMAGLSVRTGLQTGLSSVATAHTLQSMGRIDPNYVASVGGLEGFAGRMAQIQLGMSQTMGGQALFSRMFGKDGSFRDDFGEALGRRRLSADSSMARHVDPYALSGMQEQFQGMSRAAVLARVSAIQMSGESRIERNRRQYEFLASTGITSADEQLQYLNYLRAAPRADFARQLQGMQDESVMSRPDASRRASSLSSMFDRMLSEIGSNMGNSLERFGAALQVRAERALRDVALLAEGRDYQTTRTYRARMGDMDSLQRIAAGGDTAWLFRDPVRQLERDLESRSLRNAFGALFDVSGGGLQTTRSRGLFEGSLFEYHRTLLNTERGIASARDAAMNRLFPEDETNVLNIDRSEGRLGALGMVARLYSNQAGGDAATGIYGGRVGGQRRYLTTEQFLNGIALDHGGSYTAETGFVQASDQAIAALDTRGGGGRRDALERQIIRDLRDMDFGGRRRRSTAGWATAGVASGATAGALLGALPGAAVGALIGGAAGTLGGFVAPGLARSMNATADSEGIGMGSLTPQHLADLRARRGHYRDLISERYYGQGRNWASLSPSEQAALMVTERRRGGQIAEAVFGQGAVGSIGAEQFAANVSAQAAGAMVSSLVHGTQNDALMAAAEDPRLRRGLGITGMDGLSGQQAALGALASSGLMTNGVIGDGRTGDLIGSMMGILDARGRSGADMAQYLAENIGSSGFGANASVRLARAQAMLAMGGDEAMTATRTQMNNDPFLRSRLRAGGLIDMNNEFVAPGQTPDEIRALAQLPGLQRTGAMDVLNQASGYLRNADIASYVGVRNRQAEESLGTLRDVNADQVEQLLGATAQTLGSGSAVSGLIGDVLERRRGSGGTARDLYKLDAASLSEAIDALNRRGDDQSKALARALERQRGLFESPESSALTRLQAVVGGNLFDSGTGLLDMESILRAQGSGVSGLDPFVAFAQAQSDQRISTDSFVNQLRQTGAYDAYTTLRSNAGFSSDNEFLLALRSQNSAATSVVSNLANNLVAAGAMGVGEDAQRRTQQDRIADLQEQFLTAVVSRNTVQDGGQIRVYIDQAPSQAAPAADTLQ